MYKMNKNGNTTIRDRMSEKLRSELSGQPRTGLKKVRVAQLGTDQEFIMDGVHYIVRRITGNILTYRNIRKNSSLQHMSAFSSRWVELVK